MVCPTSCPGGLRAQLDLPSWWQAFHWWPHDRVILSVPRRWGGELAVCLSSSSRRSDTPLVAWLESHALLYGHQRGLIMQSSSLTHRSAVRLCAMRTCPGRCPGHCLNSPHATAAKSDFSGPTLAVDLRFFRHFLLLDFQGQQTLECLRICLDLKVSAHKAVFLHPPPHCCLNSAPLPPPQSVLLVLGSGRHQMLVTMPSLRWSDHRVERFSVEGSTEKEKY